MRSRSGLALVVLVALVAALVYALIGAGGSGPGQSGGARQRSPEFGADMGVIFQSRYPQAVVNRALGSAAQAGLGLARAAPLWELTEPAPPTGSHHHYDWRYDDLIARELAGHGFRWVAVLAFAPPWASVRPGVLHAAPREPGQYAAYAAAVARRYRGRISAFEIWNEENLASFWRPAPDPVAYARLYAAARRAIHAVDPGVPVVIGGLARGHQSFLVRLLGQPELRRRVDGVALHAYAPTPARIVDVVSTYRHRLQALGFGGVPLYVTEYGWSSRPVARLADGTPTPPGSYAPASLRPRFIVQAARDVLASGCNVRMALFYAWLTAGRDPQALYQWYGVASPDGGATSATEAIASQVGQTRVRAASARACGAQG